MLLYYFPIFFELSPFKKIVLNYHYEIYFDFIFTFLLNQNTFDLVFFDHHLITYENNSIL